MKQSRKVLKFSKSAEIKRRLIDLSTSLQLHWIEPKRLFVYTSTGSKTRAYARTWGLPRIWQESLKVDPAYIIELISERFFKLSERDQDRILLHELTHIPRNFSGALVPHTRRGKGSFHKKLELLLKDYYLNHLKNL